MELLLLKAYGGGYRGCLIDGNRYRYFQFSRKKGIRYLKNYSKKDFEDDSHFMAMMQKFATPPSFLQPPIHIEALSNEVLEQVYKQIMKMKKSRKNKPA